MEEYIGKKFGKLTVLRSMGKDKYSHKLIEIQCECDKQTIFTTRLERLLHKSCVSCGCKSIGNTYRKKENIYNLLGEYGIGYTFKGEEFYFDLEDYNKIKNICWSMDKKGYLKGVKNKNIIGLHNLVMDNLYIDHVFLNPYDNRKKNLRLATHSQNNMNKKGYGVMSKFGLKGITWHKETKKWHGQIEKNKKVVYSAYHLSIKESIINKIEAEKIHFGEYRYAWENDIKWDELFEYEKKLKTL